MNIIEKCEAAEFCVSPFGYGEVCWRDFEAMLCGCLVIKPDMSHVETNPDIFRPHETYVPVQWDYADLEEKCSYYLEHEGERQRIVDQAFKAVDEFYKNGGIIKSILNLLDCLASEPKDPDLRWGQSALKSSHLSE